MYEIKIDDKIYVLKEDVEKELSKNNNTNPKFENLCVTLLDECNVMGIGSTHLTGDWNYVKITTQYLENAINALKLMTYKNKKNDSSVIVIALSKNMPLCLGNVIDKNNKKMFSGIIIAPRVDEE